MMEFRKARLISYVDSYKDNLQIEDANEIKPESVYEWLNNNKTRTKYNFTIEEIGDVLLKYFYKYFNNN